MKALAVLLQLLLIAGPILAADVESGQSPSEAKDAKVKSSAFALKPKSRVIGVTLAIVPGFLIHGMGHHYAKKHSTALMLHLVEAGAIGLIAAGAAGGYKDLQDINDDMPTDISKLSKYEAMILGGVVLFFSGWFYDLFGTPKAVADYNATLMDREAELSGFGPGAAQRTLCLATGFSLAGLDITGVSK